MAITNSQTKPTKDQYQHCKDTGTCYDCGKPVGKSNLNGSAKCPTCYKKHLKYSRSKRAMRRKNHLCHFCGSPDIIKGLRYCMKCKSSISTSQKKHYREVKIQVFTHYGLHCECCGENHLDLLSIDHIGGGGNIHRKEIGEGTTFYRWLAKNNFPEGYRTLCHSCNFGAAQNNGTCPAHEEHTRLKFARINHFIFTNAVGMKQSITVRNLDQRLKPITMEVN